MTEFQNKQLHEGDFAPAFSLKDQTGQDVSLKDFQDQTVVLYFYPKDLTPGCTIEACDFRDSMTRFEYKNIAVLGVSRDTKALHQRFANKYDLNFSLLADTEGQVCEKYKVLKTKTLFGKTVEFINRTTFIIAPNGKIQKIYPDVKAKGHVDQILKDLVS